MDHLQHAKSTADKEILEYITTIAPYGMQAKQQTTHRLRHHKWKWRGGCPVPRLKTSKTRWL
jgi:hypothetical protein